jgi:hypothetical protein
VRLSIENHAGYDGSVPWPSAVHLDVTDAARGAGAVPWRATHARPHLVGMALGHRKGDQTGGHTSRSHRSKLKAMCQRAAAALCKLHVFPDAPRAPWRPDRPPLDPQLRQRLAGIGTDVLHWSSELALGRETSWFWRQAADMLPALRVYSRSVFCPHPPGDAPTRKAILSADLGLDPRASRSHRSVGLLSRVCGLRSGLTGTRLRWGAFPC